MQRSIQHHQSTAPPHDGEPGGDEPSRGGVWLREELLRLSRRLRRLLWIRALALLVVSIVAVLAVGVLLDWWWRPVSLWGRGTIVGLMTVGIAGSLGWFIATVWGHPITAMSVARRLESVVPGLGDRLSSALALLEQADRRPADSAELATSAIERVADEFRRAEAEKRIDRGPTLRMVATAAVVLAALLVSYFWNPAVASLAARRMVDLRGDAQWPREHQLVLVDLPSRMHAGETLQIFVADRRGPLPEDTEVQIRFADGTRRDDPVGMAGDFGLVTLEDVRQSLQVRARGGDDDTMAWRAIEVLDAPRVLTHQLRLQPPAYTGRPEVELSDTQLRVLAGTRLWLTATVSRPLQSVSLRLRREGEGEPLGDLPLELAPIAGAAGEDAPAGAMRVALRDGPLTLEQSLRAGLVWQDAAGLAGESLWELDIRVDPDAPPQLRWLEPDSDSVITPQSSPRLRAAAEDDLGLNASWFEARLVSASLVAELGRQQFDDRPPRILLESGGPPAAWFDAEGTGGPAAIAAGDTIELRAVAVDVAGQRGESAIRRLRVISQRELARQIDQLRSDAVERLRDAREQQAGALEQSQAAANRLGAGSEAQRAAADRLRAAISAQQATARALDDAPESAAQVLRRAADLAATGGLAAADIEQLVDEIEALSAANVQPAQAALEQAAEQLVGGDREAAGSQLGTATEAQREADRRLDALVESLLREDLQRALDNELTELAADQQRTRSQTRRMTQATDRDAERERLGDRQRELWDPLESTCRHASLSIL